jgi:hypothetical protein
MNLEANAEEFGSDVGFKFSLTASNFGLTQFSESLSFLGLTAQLLADNAKTLGGTLLYRTA